MVPRLFWERLSQPERAKLVKVCFLVFLSLFFLSHIALVLQHELTECRRRQLGETSEQRTAKRREERGSTKWERGRSELEALEQKRREEEASAATAHAPESCTEELSVSKDEKQKSSISSHADGVAPKEHKHPLFKAPVGPLELLALPNSHADLIRAISGEVGKEDMPNGGISRPLFRAPVGPLELLALPNSEEDYLKAFPPRGKVSEQRPAGTETFILQSEEQQSNLDVKSPLEDIVVSSEGAHTNGACIRPISPETKEEECKDKAMNGELVEMPALKRQKSVRFAANVESTTFQCSDPPSPNHKASATAAKQISGGRALNGKAGVPTEEGATTATVPLLAEEEPPHDADLDKKQAETAAEGEELSMSNKEHLQLSAEEAFFLAYGLGTLVVADPETEAPLTTEQLFLLCRQFSYFPPRTPEAVSTDDPFLVHYAVYHHFRSLGWVPRHGIKFGVDWLLYGKGPALDHAEFGIIVMPSYTDAWWKKTNGREPPRKSWHWLHSVNRVLSTVFKSLVLVYVDVPPPSADNNIGASELLQRFRVREVMVRRWSSNRNRD